MNRFDALVRSPFAWHETAAYFLASANYLLAMYTRSAGRITWSSSGTNWPVLLLYATAVENILKALRVAQGAPTVSNGRLDTYLGNHRLADYARDASVMSTLGQAEQAMLLQLQDVLEAGSYPVSKHPLSNPRAWSFEYPRDPETIWALLQKVDDALRATGTKCRPKFEPAKLLPAEALDSAAEQRDEADEDRDG